MTELFDIPESISPKLAWLKYHGLETHYDIELAEGGESPETGDEVSPWVCWKVIAGDEYNVQEPYGAGWTEEEAIIDYCHKTATPHYSLWIHTHLTKNTNRPLPRAV